MEGGSVSWPSIKRVSPDEGETSDRNFGKEQKEKKEARGNSQGSLLFIQDGRTVLFTQLGEPGGGGLSFCSSFFWGGAVLVMEGWRGRNWWRALIKP